MIDEIQAVRLKTGVVELDCCCCSATPEVFTVKLRAVRKQDRDKLEWLVDALSDLIEGDI